MEEVGRPILNITSVGDTIMGTSDLLDVPGANKERSRWSLMKDTFDAYFASGDAKYSASKREFGPTSQGVDPQVSHSSRRTSILRGGKDLLEVDLYTSGSSGVCASQSFLDTMIFPRSSLVSLLNSRATLDIG